MLRTRDTARKLVTRHLRFVAEIAAGYRNYGVLISGGIAEGNAGLMRAAAD